MFKPLILAIRRRNDLYSNRIHVLRRGSAINRVTFSVASRRCKEAIAERHEAAEARREEEELHCLDSDDDDDDYYYDDEDEFEAMESRLCNDDDDRCMKQITGRITLADFAELGGARNLICVQITC